MTLQIRIDDQIADREAFSSLGDVTPFSGRSVTRGDLATADALIVRSVTRVDRDLLANTPVRFVGTVTTGLDHIDTDFLRASGIALATAAGFNARPVAEYVLAAILLHAADQGASPSSLDLGVVGAGRIGSLVARWAECLGMRVHRNDPPLEAAGGAGPWLSLDALLRVSDVVTLHVPFTRAGRFATAGLLDSVGIGRLRPAAALINTSRGDIVDEQALKDALAANPSIHAFIDTWANEPNIDRGLVSRCRIATPHIAGHSVEAKRRGSRMIRESLAAWLAGDRRSESNHNGEGNRPGIDGKSLAGFDPSTLDAAVRGCDLVQMDARLRAALSDGGVGFDAVRSTLGHRYEFGHVIDGVRE